MRFFTTLILLFLMVSLVYSQNNIYYGNPKKFNNPATLQISKVISSHPSYPLLKSYSSEDPDFWLILERINQEILATIRKVARERGYDLVGEKGFLKKEMPDITDEVIENLRRGR